MKNTLFLALLLLSTIFSVKAQSISISSLESNDNYCAGTAMTVRYSTNNITFNTGNKFKVQIQNFGVWQDLVTEEISLGVLKATLPNTFGTRVSSYDFNVRIVSSEPVVESTSNSNYTRFNEKPNIELTGVYNAADINPFDMVNLSCLVNTGSYPINIVMNDSSVTGVGNYNTVNIFPEKTGNYFISKISNICGIGKASGSVDIKVNPSILKVTNISSRNLCLESTYTMNFASTVTFEKDNKFIVRLKRIYSDGSGKDYYFDVGGSVVQDGVISFKVPANTPIGNYQAYKLITTNPAMTSIDGVGNNFTVFPKPTVEVTPYFSTANTTINYGDKVLLKISYTGKGPFDIQLSDGKTVYVAENYGYSDIVVNAYPEKNTKYFVQSFTSTCGAGVGTKTLDITVNPNIKIDSIPSGQYCSGTKLRVKIKSNVVINTSTKYLIRMVGTNGGQAKIDVDATLIDGKFLEFIVPSDVETKLRSRALALAVVANSVEGIFSNVESYTDNLLSILEKPQGGFISTNTQTFAKPNLNSFDVTIKGGGNLIFELSDGSKYSMSQIQYSLNNYSNFISVYTQKSTIYSVKSISNNCGVGTVISNNTQSIVISSPASTFVNLRSSNINDKIAYCSDEKIKFEIIPEGDFKSDNEWKFEMMRNEGNGWTQFLSTKETKGELTLPTVTESGFYRIRAYASSPVTYSNFLYIFLNIKPIAGISSYYNDNRSTYSDYSSSLTGTISASGGGPFEITFSDKVKQAVGKEGEIEAYAIKFEKNNFTEGTFGITSVSNSCGVGTVSNSNKISYVPYRLELFTNMTFLDGIICTPANLSFNVNLFGQKATNVSYSLQIRSLGDTTFVNIASGLKGNNISMMLPEKYNSGRYTFRIITEDAYKIKSNETELNIGNSIYESTLSFNKTSIVKETTVNGGNSASIYIQSTPGSGFYVIKDNFNRFYSGYNNYSIYSAWGELSVLPSKTTTYTLKKANSTCGFNKVAGSVKITVKPTLNVALKSSTYCPNTDVNAELSAFGDFEKDNVFKTYIFKSSDTTTIKEVANTTNFGNYTLKIPSDATRGTYTLRITSSNPVTTKNFTSINISALPDITLSGGSIINQGGTAYLTLKPKEQVFEELEYLFSDNTAGKSFNYNGDKYIIPVTPKTTTTYTLTSIKNVCGVGKSLGSAKIEVNSASDKQVNFDTQNFYYSAFCTGSIISIPFTTKGTFTTGNTFTVQMSDAQGTNFKDLKTEGSKSPLLATIPVNAPIGGSYLFKVISSDKDATSTTNLSGISAAAGATARFDTASYYFSEGKPVKINIKLTGTAPYYFSVGTDEISAKTFGSSKPIYELVLTPTTPTKFKLFSVSDGYCGRGSIIEPSVVNLELITANEVLEEMQIKLFPNPTTDVIYINSDGKKADLELVDIMGISLLQQQIKTLQEQLDITKMKTGTYFLKIYKNDKQAVFKVIKL